MSSSLLPLGMLKAFFQVTMILFGSIAIAGVAAPWSDPFVSIRSGVDHNPVAWS
jgi:hypothetical protein